MTEQLNIQEIQELLPHRYPFLMLDRVLEYSDAIAIGIKNVSANEPYFQGHFPNRPIMPGVLIVEAMAQLGGIIMLKKTNGQGKLTLFAGIDKIRFRKVVVPGDQLVLKAELLKVHANIGKVRASAHVDDELVTEGQLLFSLVDKEDNDGE